MQMPQARRWALWATCSFCQFELLAGAHGRLHPSRSSPGADRARAAGQASSDPAAEGPPPFSFLPFARRALSCRPPRAEHRPRSMRGRAGARCADCDLSAAPLNVSRGGVGGGPPAPPEHRSEYTRPRQPCESDRPRPGRNSGLPWHGRRRQTASARRLPLPIT